MSALPSTSTTLGPPGAATHLDDRCARYRWPQNVFFWGALPKPGYGKNTLGDIRVRLLQQGGELAG